MHSPQPNCTEIGWPSDPFIIFFCLLCGWHPLIKSFPGSFHTAEEAKWKSLRRTEFPEEGEVFYLWCRIILLGKRETVGSDRILPAVLKVISSVNEYPKYKKILRKKKKNYLSVKYFSIARDHTLLTRDCSPPSSSVYEIFQARILEWVAIS